VSVLVRSASLTNFPDVARSAGLDPVRMLSAAGLPARCLIDPELTVPVDNVRALLEDAASQSGLEAFGLLMAETRKLSALGPVGLIVREQPTLRLALEVLVHHRPQPQRGAVHHARGSRRGRRAARGGHRRERRRGAPVDRARDRRGVPLVGAVLGPTWRPLRVCFAHDAPADRSVHLRVFGPAVEFGHDFNGIVFRRSDLDARNPNADPAMASFAQQILDQRGRGAAGDVRGAVRDQVMLLLGSGGCSVELVARHLGVDRRTIHRRLAAEGETYSGVVDAVRGELALRYLGPRRANARRSVDAARVRRAERLHTLVPQALRRRAVEACASALTRVTP
jgi:AraC-like DNA-binding protein